MVEVVRLIIAGSREFTDYGIVVREVWGWLRQQTNWQTCEVVTGGAPGADALGEKFAEEFRLDQTVFQANWDRYKRSAGAIRNGEMAHYAHEHKPGVLFAFWDGRSPGTKNMIEKALRVGLEIHVIRVKV